MSATAELTPPRKSLSAPRLAVWAVAAVLAIALAYDMWRMPVQVFDSLQEIIEAEASPSIAHSFASAVGGGAYFRPLRIAQIKAAFDLSQGNYRLAYRGIHVVLIVALIWLFTRALPIESTADAAAAVFALTVLTGMHTFLGFLREAFPINHFLEMAVFALVALNLSLSRGGWWADVLAAVTFIVAALTLESGVLVWVVVAGAWLCGLRGVSTRGVIVVTALLAGYFAGRFWLLETGLPTLSERASGFLLERLEPDELQRRFGDTPRLFYAYNVVAAVLSVLFSEPRDGLFIATRAWLNDDVRPHTYLAIGSAVATTSLILIVTMTMWRRRRALELSDRLVIVAAFVLMANAVLAFSYAKDDIVTIAGVFYAIAAYAAGRRAIDYARGGGIIKGVVVSAALLMLATVWAIRSSGVHHVVNEHAFRTRNDWAALPLEWRREGRWPSDPGQLRVIEALRQDALDSPMPNPNQMPEWRQRWYGE
jgi:hypothetical protein